MASEERKQLRKSPYYLEAGSSPGTDLGMVATGLSVSDVGSLILLLIIVVGGVVALIYFIAVAFVNLVTLGEVHRASVYSNKVKRYSVGETFGSYLARDLTKMNIYFSAVLLVFTAEEAIRFFLHTGPATIEIWYFRIACLVAFIVILLVFFVRLGRWMNYKSDPKYVRASNEIKEHDEERKALETQRASKGKHAGT